MSSLQNSTITPTFTSEHWDVVISPKVERRGMFAELRDLWSYRLLIQALVQREFRIRYKNSKLGIGWSLVAPLVNVMVMTFAIGVVMGGGPTNMSAYLLCAMAPWTFFSASVMDSSASVLGQMPLIKKLHFPREIPVVVACTANSVFFAIMVGVFILYRYILAPIRLGWPGLPPLALLWLPVVVLILYFTTLGVSLFIAAANVFYEDVKFATGMGLGFLQYLMPILYFSENIFYSKRIPRLLQSPLYHAYLVNPLAWVITAFKQMFFQRANIAPRGMPPILSSQFDWRLMVINLVISLVVFWAGYTFFNSLKWRFAERP